MNHAPDIFLSRSKYGRCRPMQRCLAISGELGHIERTLFILDWLQSVELRRCTQAGLNEREACNAVARAIFRHPLGEIRDRSFEQQRYPASGLNLVVAAIVLWNTVYLERAVRALKSHNQQVDEGFAAHVTPRFGTHKSQRPSPMN